MEAIERNTKGATSAIKGMGEETEKAKEKATSGVEKISGAVSAINSGVVKAATAIGALYKGFNSLFKVAGKYVNQANELVETNNLYASILNHVEERYYEAGAAQSKFYEEGLKYIADVQNGLRVNNAELERYQATFFAMLNNQGIDSETAFKMSKSLTNAALDMSSLYDTTFSDQAKKIQSAISGQIKALRGQGVDVSASSLQGIADSLGIDRNISQFSYAEKEILRYIGILQQAGYAQGDFAKTFNSSANQVKVLQEEIKTLGQRIGVLFQGMYTKVISVVRGVIQAITMVVEYIGSLFGIDFQNTGGDSAIGAIETMEDGIEGIGSGLDSATSSAKAFKKQILGFDEINNITPPSSSSGGGSGGGGIGYGNGTIDSALLNAIGEWDLKMGSIKDAAKDYRDKILEALGFVTDGSKILGWSIDNVSPQLKAIGGILAAWAGINFVVKLAEVVSAFEKIGSLMNGAVGKFFGVAIGTGITFDGLFRINDAVTKLSNGLGDAEANWKKLAGGLLESTVGGAIIGGSLGGAKGALIGGGIGLLIGAFDALGTAIYNAFNPIYTASDELQELRTKAEKATKEYTDFVNGLDIKYSEDLEKNSKFKKFLDDLDLYVEKNGKIKEGYEERVNFIKGELKEGYGIEMEILDGTIQGWEDLRKAIEDTIEKERAEIKLSQSREKYKNAYEQAEEVTTQLAEAKSNLKGGSVQETEAALGVGSDYYVILRQLAKQSQGSNFDEEMFKKFYINSMGTKSEQYANWASALETYDELSDLEAKLNQDMAQYESDFAYFEAGEYEKVGRDFVDTTKKWTAEAAMEEINFYADSVKRMQDVKKLYAENNDAITKDTLEHKKQDVEAHREALSSMYELVLAKNPEIVGAFKTLATSSRDEYAKVIAGMPEDTRQEVMDVVGVVLSDRELENAMKSLGKTSTNGYNEETKKGLNTAATVIFPDGMNKINSAAKIGMGAVNTTYESSLKTTETTTSSKLKGVVGLFASNMTTAKTTVDNGMSKTNTSISGWLDTFKRTIDGKAPSVASSGAEFGKSFFTGYNQNNPRTLATNTASGYVNRLAELINSRGGGSIWDIGQRFGRRIFNSIKDFLGIASPSKLTAELGGYTALGFAVGLQEETSTAVESAKQLAAATTNVLQDELSGNTKFEATSQINYGEIAGAVNSNVSVSSGNLANQIAAAVSTALQETNVNVNIEAKTEEGILVKKVADGFNQAVRRTGSLPFTVPI